MGFIASTETRHASGFPYGGAALVAAFPITIVGFFDRSQDTALYNASREGQAAFP